MNQKHSHASSFRRIVTIAQDSKNRTSGSAGIPSPSGAVQSGHAAERAQSRRCRVRVERIPASSSKQAAKNPCCAATHGYFPARSSASKAHPPAANTAGARCCGKFSCLGSLQPGFADHRAQVWSWREAECIDAGFFRGRIASALSARRDLKLADEQQRHAPDPRRIRRSAGADRRSLRRRAGDADRQRGAGTLARHLSPTSCRNSANLRASTNAPIPIRADWKAWSRATAYCAARCLIIVEVVENGLRFEVDVAARTEDRFLSRPARQPRADRNAGARQRRAELLLLHRRLLAVCAARRREIGAVDRCFG